MVKGIICFIFVPGEKMPERRERQTNILLKLREQINQYEEVSLD